MINVLYITFASTNFDGATYSLMDLIRSVRTEVNPIILLRSKGCVYDYFQQHGIECIICDFEENLVGKPIKLHQYVKYAIRYIPKLLRYNKINQRCVNNIVEQLKDRHIDIVHTNNTVLSIGHYIAKRLKAKHVWHLRGFMDLDFGWMPFTGWKKLKQEIAESDAVIGITKAVLEHFVNPQALNAYTIFDAVRSKKEICNIIYPKEKYFLFCAGLLSKKKGCDFAILAFAQSNLAAQGYRLRIIGDCNPKYYQNLKLLAIKNNVLNNIDFIGRSENVKEHMEKATAFLMCSENEGLGRVSIEAMFYGCPVIGRNSGGTKEFILNKKTGFIFNNIQECASAMQKTTSTNMTPIIKQAQEFACLNFSIENYGSKILTIYHKIITIK